MYKIAVCDHIHQKGLDMLASQSDITLLNLASLPKDELLQSLQEVDVAITRSSTAIGDKFLANVPALKAIVRAGVGVDNVDIDACSKQGIVVMNVPTANTIAAVELTMTHILSAIRNFPGANAQLKDERKWKREDWYGTELKGKRVGVIGFGNIGSRVGIRCKAFEAEVLTYDPYILPSKAINAGVSYVKDFDEILSCDIITIHTPKNTETKNMITAKEIAKMKDGVILINCARGGLYNEEDLYQSLQSGKVRWAGIDVFDKEPGTSCKLLDLPNVYVTPHIGANTLESQEEIAKQAAQAAMEAARGIAYPNALNLPSNATQLPDFVGHYTELAQKLGFLCSQLDKSVLTSLEIATQGEISQYIDSLEIYAIVGALKPSLGDKINYVNAPFLAKERGIEIKKKASESSTSYKNLITLTAYTNNGSLSVSGTVFDDNIIRLSAINEFEALIEPKGRMILFKNTDVPGVIGSVGQILGKHQINIADFRLARNAKNEALAVILVDNAVSNAVLQELSQIDACISLHMVVI
ncbi:phosphoglycerate dehydrogenase [Helicobacter zhangjianzhongii]|uniref:Phosphoglycerate dehydrogenase n=1 Tax=Helicobacter zhangjianzhongii TaxID=2974574 RepID=A0ACC6FSG5_9HELI|nr:MULTISPECIES: phosphoglycerate dehydrogenase [unclassified Helicobacter]MDL0080160.1 phosphoglycerate dehydrogenase [Helicobacter sp. CPD2-1]MDL0082219.1 phosphoglycerate dehydrogenase [Helicobacter sp. XJK30-2]